MSAQTFTPTQKMAANARRGLKLHEKFKRGGTEVGVKRAHQLAARDAVSEKDVKAMASYFARHTVDKDGQSHRWNNNDDPSAGFIAWLLWGGDDGERWAKAKRKSLEN
jgi:hypothetical protein